NVRQPTSAGAASPAPDEADGARPRSHVWVAASTGRVGVSARDGANILPSACAQSSSRQSLCEPETGTGVSDTRCAAAGIAIVAAARAASAKAAARPPLDGRLRILQLFPSFIPLPSLKPSSR